MSTGPTWTDLEEKQRTVLNAARAWNDAIGTSAEAPAAMALREACFEYDTFAAAVLLASQRRTMNRLGKLTANQRAVRLARAESAL